MMEKEVEKQGV